MSLRKVAGLLAAFGLMLGLIGGGVGAVFTDSLTATENISVGTFACKIVAATPGAASDGIALDGKSLTFAAPPIESSAAGSAPFSFTVQNTGSIDQVLTITPSGPYGSLSGKFSAVALAPYSPAPLAAGASQVFTTGIQWTTLDSTDLGDSGSFTWTVNCGEVPAPPELPANTYEFNSTNDWNRDGLTPGHVGQHSYVDAVPGANEVTLTFYNIDYPQYVCFEWRTDGNVPEQRLRADENAVGPPFADSMLTQFSVPGINDGLYKYACPGYSGYGTPGAVNLNPTIITVPVLQYVEVRLTFGGESDYRFDWTRFDALP